DPPCRSQSQHLVRSRRSSDLGTGDPATAWQMPIAGVEGVAHCPRAYAREGNWADANGRSCPNAFPRNQHDQSRGPSLPPRSAARSEEHTSELQSLTNIVCRLL